MERLPGNQQADSPVKRALRAIDDLQAKLTAMERKKSEPIAVVGMGCRFPGGADNPDLFWNLLKNGEDAIRTLPADRWNIDDYYDVDPDAPGKMYIRHGGFLGAIDRFDAPFFGISPREAMCMDPQHRLVLEVSWEALEYAGIAPADLNGSRTGVFVGIGQNDYARLKLTGADPTRIDTYDGTGNLFCFAAGRLAYILGLRGPNMAIDTACSSSLVALHQACQSLRSGDCDLALAGGVHLVISPEVTIFLSRAHVLSPGRHCKTFDAAADGFVRGEGCGMIVVKRLADARRDGDTILALIRGSAINHDGASSGLTVPNELAQEELILAATQQAGVAPDRVTYVEAHGTGTALGDPIEVNALAASLCKGRAPDNPLWIGSVKTNLGHLEAAAGIAGVIKVILALQHKEIPPHLHFKTPNPHIDWQKVPIQVAAQARAWPPAQGPRIAGVSAFGFSGTNAHIVLADHAETVTAAPQDAAGALHILTLSAKSAAALHALAQRYEAHLAVHPEQAVADICYTANTGRSPFSIRMAVISATREELSARLAAFREGRACPGLYKQDRPDGGDGGVSRGAPDPDGHALAALAGQYVRGGDIAWRDHYRGRGYRKVALPTYPFERQRHWVADQGHRTLPGREQALSLGGKRLHLPFSRDVRFENRFSENSPAHLADHRLLGTVVVSAASQVTMVLASAAKAFGADACQINDMLFSQPLLIPVQGDKDVQLIYLPAEEGAFTFRLVSGGDGAKDTDDSWTTHASGTVVLASKGRPEVSPPRFDPDGFRSRSGRVLSGDDFYAARDQAGYQFGPSFRWAQRIWQTENETLCEMAPHFSGPQFLEIDGDDSLHPGLLDSCFQMIDGFRQADADAEYLHVPVKISRLRLYRHPPVRGLWCLAQRQGPSGANARTRTGSLRLMDEKGAALVEVDGFELGKAPRALFSARKPRAATSYEVNWRPMPSASRARFESPAESIHGVRLLFADRSGVAAELAAQLRARGEQVLLVTQERQFAAYVSDHYGVNPESPADFSRLLQVVGMPLLGVIYLWALDIGAEVDEVAMVRGEIACAGLCAAVRALVEQANGSPPPMWFVTQGALPVGRGPVAALQAMLWGVGNVLDIEHPECRPRGIDLAPGRSEAQIPMLVEEILHPDGENRIALRDDLRHVARLARCEPTPAVDLHLEADAAYLITGGLGGLGLEAAQWMGSNGARHMVLCGRNAPIGQAAEMIGRIEKAGCKVLVVTADVSDRRDVDRLMAAIEAGMPPLRGILHVAGVIDDGMLIRLDSGRFKTVNAPKVRGTWHLHAATAGRTLDFFVCFSSAAAIVGAGGQANYAAANAFLDAFVHARRVQGLPGLSVNWGAWDEVGMAARMKADVRQRTAAQGMGAISPEEGLAILGELLERDATQVCVMAMDWRRYLSHHYPKGSPLFFQAFAGEATTQGKSNDLSTGSAGWLNEIPADQRQARLFDYVRSQVAATLGMASPEELSPRQRLFDIGIDSLMAVELKNRLEAGLGVSLRATLVFDYPTVEALTTHLAQEALASFFPSASIQEECEASPDDDEISSLLSQIEAVPEQDLRALFSGAKMKVQGQFK